LNIKGITVNGINFEIRENTTDEKVVDEVIRRNTYLKNGVDVERNEIWLDCGANIGTFTCLACSLGAFVIAYEPEKENFERLKRNIFINGFSVKEIRSAVVAGKEKSMYLFICKGEYNKYRHTLNVVRGRKFVSISCVNFDDVLNENISGIKMDIEGEELKILDQQHNWYNVKKMVMEYHFDFDRYVENFYERMNRLKEAGFIVNYSKIKDGLKRYDFYPASKIVYCTR